MAVAVGIRRAGTRGDGGRRRGGQREGLVGVRALDVAFHTTRTLRCSAITTVLVPGAGGTGPPQCLAHVGEKGDVGVQDGRDGITRRERSWRAQWCRGGGDMARWRSRSFHKKLLRWESGWAVARNEWRIKEEWVPSLPTADAAAQIGLVSEKLRMQLLTSQTPAPSVCLGLRLPLRRDRRLVLFGGRWIPRLDMPGAENPDLSDEPGPLRPTQPTMSASFHSGTFALPIRLLSFPSP